MTWERIPFQCNKDNAIVVRLEKIQAVLYVDVVEGFYASGDPILTHTESLCRQVVRFAYDTTSICHRHWSQDAELLVNLYQQNDTYDLAIVVTAPMAWTKQQSTLQWIPLNTILTTPNICTSILQYYLEGHKNPVVQYHFKMIHKALFHPCIMTEYEKDKDKKFLIDQYINLVREAAKEHESCPLYKDDDDATEEQISRITKWGKTLWQAYQPIRWK
jgi:hypothetical protein